ncbi:3-phosphoglycerate dehydrogenase [Elizabethkingia meningoseptica]|uniref:3-phosphoglycerate dehydrogenase n=1 Tax=Elizabethkingia meningoseptica TaxID=238 RepID=A0A1T3FKL3_ELIME|nr:MULTISPECIES: D-2-hydroxyacid dehydrogenase [Elizabethkingia]AQX13545.1 3-phosphoglycerate dehydrogenase [Elizabethkingia meningoseptica]MBG0515276.1 D-2-hydroxyacid dehydrogenase [Elizabethkingia meningoseptica]MDE5434304.1 D-2-hydroxyacid dehydrogenase [Elizabethkingia meningoseptica]MDE5448167.1 D-2-hydroxyacid dehydrogenase [Elizabethkingia meningoseptica]MDE5470655.1 D-2-hydroxyacid dehydrogenase [Elizabethkingia meningoseptica]
MGKILANDGLSGSGIEKLTKYGFQVITDKVPQEELIEYINTNGVDVLLVRSATKVRKDIIDSCPSLKIIGRGGVGMDNIDVEYAREKGLKVINTPAASSESVAELVFAHLYSGMRFLYESNRQMPVKGNTDFEKMKKAFGGGAELRGKTIGIIGMGRIGVEVARIALGLRMKVIAADTFVGKANIEVDFYNGQSINVDIITEPIEEILKQADIITLHVPAQKDFVIGKEELAIMKGGVVLINCARGGVIDEEALIEALDSGKVRFAGLDVFENEPAPSEKILTHSKISLSPHIGAATLEAQDRIGTELADQIFQILS